MRLDTIALPRHRSGRPAARPLSIKWHGLAYMAGLLLGWLYVKYLLRRGELWPAAGRPFAPKGR